MKVIIIDDDSTTRERLHKYIDQFCPQVKVVGMADSVADGAELINEIMPDLIFLDILLSDGTGFDLIDQLDIVDFHIIFITAYDEYAIKAFQYNAMHYILKPFLAVDIIEAVEKASRLNSIEIDIKKLLPLLQSGNHPHKIAIPSVSKVNYIYPSNIIQCIADGTYTLIYIENSNTIISSKPLKQYDILLNPFGFYRIHRSHLVNLDKVKEYRKGASDALVLMDGTVIEISRKKRTDFLLAMSQR